MKLIQLTVTIALFLGCIISLGTGCESSGTDQVTSTKQPELCDSSFGVECIPVGDFPKEVYSSPRGQNEGFHGRLQDRGSNEELNALSGADRGVSLRCRSVFECLGRCREWIMNSFHHEMAALICRGLPGVFDYESDNKNSGFVSLPGGLNHVDISTKLPLSSILHSFDSGGRGVGTLLCNYHSFSHPFFLTKHGRDLTEAHKHQKTCEADKPPVRRRFVISLLGCFGGYSLGLWSLGRSNRLLSRFFLGLGLFGIVFGLSCWGITFAFPQTWCWPI
jgi:hypothetical protein